MTSTPPIPDCPPSNFTSDPSLAAFSTPIADFLAARPQHEGLCTGAFVFCRHTRRLLLLQRASTDSFPDRYEVPGGAVDDDDPSILHGVARELWEETGLLLRKVVRIVKWPGAAAGGVLADSEGGGVFFSRRGIRAVKFSFEVGVEEDGFALEGEPGLKVALRPSEHQSYLWVTEEEARAKVTENGVKIEYTTLQHEEIIYEAFRARKEEKA